MVMTGWQPIETAPKNGKEVLLLVKSRAGMPYGMLVGHYMQGGHCIEDHPPIDRGWYFWSGSMFDKASEPTHWMPLPDRPPIEPKRAEPDGGCECDDDHYVRWCPVHSHKVPR